MELGSHRSGTASRSPAASACCKMLRTAAFGKTLKQSLPKPTWRIRKAIGYMSSWAPKHSNEFQVSLKASVLEFYQTRITTWARLLPPVGCFLGLSLRVWDEAQEACSHLAFKRQHVLHISAIVEQDQVLWIQVLVVLADEESKYAIPIFAFYVMSNYQLIKLTKPRKWFIWFCTLTLFIYFSDISWNWTTSQQEHPASSSKQQINWNWFTFTNNKSETCNSWIPTVFKPKRYSLNRQLKINLNNCWKKKKPYNWSRFI